MVRRLLKVGYAEDVERGWRISIGCGGRLLGAGSLPVTYKGSIRVRPGHTGADVVVDNRAVPADVVRV